MKVTNLIHIIIAICAINLCTLQVGSMQASTSLLTSSDSLSYPVLESDNSEESTQMNALSFESLLKTLQTQLAQAKRKKQSTEALEKRIEQCEEGLNSLRATNKVVFIDSIVVDKDALLSAYKFNPELGTINLTSDNQAASYTTELGTLTYRTEKNAEGHLTVNSYYVEDGNYIKASQLADLELQGDINYPYMLPDGSTLYFASRDPRGHGNYDIYVTRFDSEDRSYLTPTNLGYPFNSYANDYLMVIDDDLGIGWFASDRRQPEGKVCIYTFIQPKARRTYDYETDSRNAIINAARINSIKDTWKGNEDAIRAARQQLALKQSQISTNVNHEFTFIINDNYTYHSLSDFRNPEAKALFQNYRKQQEELDTLLSTLAQLRTQSMGQSIKAQILKMEKQVGELTIDIHKTEKDIRKLELK